MDAQHPRFKNSSRSDQQERNMQRFAEETLALRLWQLYKIIKTFLKQFKIQSNSTRHFATSNLLSPIYETKQWWECQRVVEGWVWVRCAEQAPHVQESLTCGRHSQSGCRLSWETVLLITCIFNQRNQASLLDQGPAREPIQKPYSALTLLVIESTINILTHRCLSRTYSLKALFAASSQGPSIRGCTSVGTTFSKKGSFLKGKRKYNIQIWMTSKIFLLASAAVQACIGSVAKALVRGRRLDRGRVLLSP